MTADAIELAALVSHPIQYQAPLFRSVPERDTMNLTVYFCSKRGVHEQLDEGFGTEIVWDIPLLEGYEYEFLPNYTPLNTTGIGLVNPDIVTAIRDNDYDALWVHGYSAITNWLAFAAARMTEVPIILRGETTSRNDNPSPFRRSRDALLKKLFAHVSAFATIGTLNREFYRELGVSDERLFHAPYTVDNNYFQSRAAELPAKSALREAEGLSPDTPVVLFVGKLINRKRPQVLLDAFDRATTAGEANLLFVGEGEQRDTLESMNRSCGREADIHLLGFKNQSELPRYYKMADVFVLPSARENWGLVVNEAMNFELPVVTSDAVGAAADLVDKQNGGTVPVDDPEALAAVLKRLLQDETLRKAMGETSKERIDRWGIEDTTGGIVEAARYVADWPC